MEGAGRDVFEGVPPADVVPAQATAALEPWFRLRAIERLGDLTLLKLVQTWGSPEAVLRASREDLIQKGCNPSLADAIRRGPDGDARRRIDRELTALQRTPIQVRTFLDLSYPARLRTIPDPPPLLYVSGTLNESDELAVAIVGARRATAAGRVLTEELAQGFAEAGFTVVSGLARGVDAAAHRGALAGGGRTIAVLGCGLDRTYPPEHDRLRHEIEARGGVVSELPLGAPPHSAHFPRRNRIISGLSLGVIVSEAAINSGSLITARLAADQGREVFAVPGFVKTETSRGTNALIKEGAMLIEQAQDAIDALIPQLEPSMRAKLKSRSAEQPPSEHFGNQEQLVYDALSYEPSNVDELVAATQLSVPSVMAALLVLELRQRAKQLSGQRYLRI
jgi:DNA processing protein